MAGWHCPFLWATASPFSPTIPVAPKRASGLTNLTSVPSNSPQGPQMGIQSPLLPLRSCSMGLTLQHPASSTPLSTDSSAYELCDFGKLAKAFWAFISSSVEMTVTTAVYMKLQ